MTIAYAWASGLIEFTETSIPEGALLVADYDDRGTLEGAVSVVARHGKGESEGKYIVPNIPEADLLGLDPVNVLTTFKAEVRKRLPVFSPEIIAKAKEAVSIDTDYGHSDVGDCLVRRLKNETTMLDTVRDLGLLIDTYNGG